MLSQGIKFNKLFEYNYVPSRGQCFLTSADEQKTVNHHQLYFFNPDKNTNSTYKGNDDDLDSLMDFIDKEMGISSGKQQVNQTVLVVSINSKSKNFYYSLIDT